MRKIAWTSPDPERLFRHGGVLPNAEGILDFSASLNPLGPPRSVLAALRRELSDIKHYPDPECCRLRHRLAALHGVAPEQVIVGNGANELIYLIAQTFRPKRVAIAEPTYTEYLRASRSVGAEVDHWLPEDDEEFTPQLFDPQGADLVWLCNPNNPTGKLWPEGCSLTSWIAAHPRTLFVVDESFLSLCHAAAFRSVMPSLRTVVPRRDQPSNLVIVRSLTKYYALPGLRLGYAVTSVERALSLRAHAVPCSVNTLAQTAGLHALDDLEFEKQTDQWLRGEVTSFIHGLGGGQWGLHPLQSQVNFVLVRLQGVHAGRVVTWLAERKIAVRDASNFVGLDERYIRIAARTRGDNRRLLDGLKALFQGG
jgi:threonine-phosphate decarboxylase